MKLDEDHTQLPKVTFFNTFKFLHIRICVHDIKCTVDYSPDHSNAKVSFILAFPRKYFLVGKILLQFRTKPCTFKEVILDPY